MVIKVRPLYPPPPKPPAKPTPEPRFKWKDPRFLIAVACLIFLVLITKAYRSRRSAIDPEALPKTTQESRGILPFLGRSNHFKSQAASIELESKFARLGLSTDSEILANPPETSDYREKRRTEAIQKHLLSREQADSFVRAREERKNYLSTPVSTQLKEAVTSLDSHGTLGIMKLERLLDETNINSQSVSGDVDAIIYGYTVLGDSYVERDMPDEAKKAYLKAFQIIKEQAPAEQKTEWERVITTIESARAQPRAH